jgi:flagellar motor protein MotB
MDGEIIQQRSSYRQGLVLGLTMAEIMLLLVFCLLIAMASFLKTEQKKLADVKQELQQQQAQNERDHDVVAALHQNTALAEKLQNLSGLTDPKEIDKYWRELVDSRTAMTELDKNGVSIKELRDRIADIEKLRSNGIDIDKALRDADVVGAINRTMTKPGQPPVSTLAILDAIERGKTGLGPSGHQWPPIISLSEAGGYSFTIGSAELSTPFHDQLVNKTISEILENIKKYDVDVIEVVGHTDEQPIGTRPSNLDRDLLSVLNSTSNVAKLIPADNAGLGLARAVSVVSVLRQDPRLAAYKLIPLSGAQLVNTDETLATQGAHGDIPQRRRIEIRLRKSVPHETAASIVTVPVVATPKPRPVPRPGPLSLTPTIRPAPRSYPQTGTPTTPTRTTPR